MDFSGVFLHRICRDVCAFILMFFVLKFCHFSFNSSVSQLCVCPAAPRCEQGGAADAVADLSARKAVEDVSLAALAGNQTPGSIPGTDLSQSSSLLRPILKRTPGRELPHSPEADSMLAPRMSIKVLWGLIAVAWEWFGNDLVILGALVVGRGSGGTQLHLQDLKG